MSGKITIKKSTKRKEVAKSSDLITLNDFLTKYKLSGYVRQAYLKKFNLNDKMSEQDWLSK